MNCVGAKSGMKGDTEIVLYTHVLAKTGVGDVTPKGTGVTLMICANSG